MLGSETPELTRVLAELRITLTRQQLQLDPAPLLRLVLEQFFGGHAGLVDALLSSVPDPVAAAPLKVQRFWQGDRESALGRAMSACDAAGPLAIQVVRMYRTEDAADFVAFGRVMSGTAQAGQEVDVCGEGCEPGCGVMRRYSAADTEDMVHTTIAAVAVSQGRYHLDISRCRAGNWVMLRGLGDAVQRTATVLARNLEDAAVFRPLEFNTQAVVKLAVEPRKPSELPLMVEALRKVQL